MKETRALHRHRLRIEGELQEHYSVEEALEAIQSILDRHSPDCRVKLYEKELEIRNGFKVRSRSDRLKISLIAALPNASMTIWPPSGCCTIWPTIFISCAALPDTWRWTLAITSAGKWTFSPGYWKLSAWCKKTLTFP